MPSQITLASIRHHAVSDRGLRRSCNEDAYAVCAPGGAGPGAYLFAVGDGIGGHTCGDIASDMACRELKALFENTPHETGAGGCARRLGNLFHTLDARIRQEGIVNPTCADMGTTLSALMIAEDFGAVAHAGDSRIYRLRGKRLDQLTTDHTFVQEMIAEGELTVESALHHPLRSMLTRAVGTQEPLDEVQTAVVELAPGDRYLLCSDGLHGLVAADEIALMLAAGDDPGLGARALVKTALERGGHDNVTVIVVHL